MPPPHARHGNHTPADMRRTHPPLPVSLVHHVGGPRLPTLLFSHANPGPASKLPSRPPANPPRQWNPGYPESLAERHTKLGPKRHRPQSIDTVLQSCKSAPPRRPDRSCAQAQSPQSGRDPIDRDLVSRDSEICDWKNCPPRSMPSPSASPPSPVEGSAENFGHARSPPKMN
jgi:hypothetical protein